MYQTTPWPIVAPNKANNTNLKFNFLPKDSFSGLATIFPSSFAFSNIGDSSIFLRMKYDIPTMTMDMRNGMRQPKFAKASALIDFLVARITNKEINKPKEAVV